MISIVNYQAGNLKSLSNSLRDCGFECCVTDDPDIILDSDLAILPGVGAFPDAAASLKSSGLWEVLKKRHDEGKPIMGICLGMQLFYESSEEIENTEGLGFLKGKVVLLTPDNELLKVPHMGWNNLQASTSVITGTNKRTDENINNYIREFENGFAYFVHSYGVVDGEESTEIFHTEHGQKIPALVIKADEKATGNVKGAVIGFQFHPEKSGELGNKLLSMVIKKEVYGE